MTQIVERPGGATSAPVLPVPAAPVSRKFRPDIEGLRAFAVCSVVVYHAGLGIRGGYVGVDVFFVISGFLITRQLRGSIGRSGIRALPAFYARRVRRLLPASAAVVIATMVAAHRWASPIEVRSIATDGIFTTFYGLNYRLAIEGTQYLHQGEGVSPLQHFWSLGVEEQFYLFWPLLLLTVVLMSRRMSTPVLAGGLVVLIALSFHWSVVITGASAPWGYFALQTRAWELALGALVAVCADLLVRLPRAAAEAGGWLGLALIVGSSLVLSDQTPYPGAAATVPVAGITLLIACGCGGRRGVERILGDPLLQCVGRISYSWYLWHWPMLIIAPLAVGHPLTWVQRLLVVWASAVAALLCYFTIEDPCRRLSLSNGRVLLCGTALSAAVVAVGAWAIADPPSMLGRGAPVTLPADATSAPQFLTEVRAAVASGMQTVAAPSNLTPHLQDANGDTPDPSHNGCHLDLLAADQGACAFGDPHGTHTAVLFGDSHMEQWEPALGIAGARLHWRIVNWTKSACPAAELTVVSPTLNRRYTECDTWRARTLTRITALHPDLVLAGESENTDGDYAFTPADWANATLRTLTTLRSNTHATVIFVGDTPAPRQLAPECVSQHLGDVRPCRTDLAQSYPDPQRHRALRPAIRAAGFAYIDPEPWLCTRTGCPAVIGNFLVYRDATHVSREYVEWLTPLLAPYLKSRR